MLSLGLPGLYPPTADIAVVIPVQPGGNPSRQSSESTTDGTAEVRTLQAART